MKIILATLVGILCTVSSASIAQSPASSFIAGTASDEAAIRSIVSSQSADREDPRVAADLDWENAFGIRYSNLKKRNDWFNANIKPQFKNATNDTLEVKIRFLETTIAVADEYWHVAGQVYAGDTKPGPDRWGRTTYVFKKENGTWTEVLERVADLRSAYFKHYEAIPVAERVDPATLASYAGKYETSQGKPFVEISVSDDHLTITNKHGTYTGIPTSATEFLGFNPDDLAEYYRIAFQWTTASAASAPKLTLTLSRADGEPIATASKAP
jgi:hypothetical protein